ncbi:MAG: methyl-accepting chemotaxis protein, partial [Fibrobacter sp.]|nr:methyl-accepting chemotaxis protein [Fibrobacter sp.]
MFKNMRIGARLGLGFGLLVLILALVGSYAINSVQKIDDSLDVMVNDRLPKIIQANEWYDGVNAVARILR